MAAPAAAAAQQASGASSGPAAAEGGAQWLRPHLRRLAPYPPIEPFEILAERFGRTPDQIIKLDANENPYGPPPEVRQALATMPFPHVYPDPESRRLRKALSDMTGVPMEHLLVCAWLQSCVHWGRGGLSLAKGEGSWAW